MTAPLDLAKVRTALLADPAFGAGLPEQAQAVFAKLIEHLPEVLKDQLDAKVTLATLMQAKLDIIERMLTTGFVNEMFAALPQEGLPMSADAMAEMMTEVLTHLRMPLMEMIHDTQGFLKSYGVTERQLLANAEGGRFSAQTLQAYDAGTLTIRSLLESQPTVLLLNGEG